MAAVAIALVAAGCATEVEAPAVEITMDPDAPVTEAPASYGIGSNWVFNHTLNGETAQMTSTLVDRTQRKGREVYVISNAVAYRDPGAPCDGADGWLFDVETDGFVACTKNGEILSSNTPYHDIMAGSTGPSRSAKVGEPSTSGRTRFYTRIGRALVGRTGRWSLGKK